MKTDEHLWQYVAQFFLESTIFQIELVEKVTIRISFNLLVPELFF